MLYANSRLHWYSFLKLVRVGETAHQVVAGFVVALDRVAVVHLVPDVLEAVTEKQLDGVGIKIEGVAQVKAGGKGVLKLILGKEAQVLEGMLLVIVVAVVVYASVGIGSILNRNSSAVGFPWRIMRPISLTSSPGRGRALYFRVSRSELGSSTGPRVSP